MKRIIEGRGDVRLSGFTVGKGKSARLGGVIGTRRLLVIGGAVVAGHHGVTAFDVSPADVDPAAVFDGIEAGAAELQLTGLRLFIVDDGRDGSVLRSQRCSAGGIAQ